MEIVCRIHWWNPFVQYLKKEFTLFLELSNDFFLIQSNLKFSITDYAELIVKTAKRIRSVRLTEPNRMMHFAVDDTSVLSTRIHFILNSQENTSRFKRVHEYLCCTVIFAMVIFSVFCVPEPNFRYLRPVVDGAVELYEGNAYKIDHGNSQYTVYHLVFSSDIYAASADTAPPEISPASHDIIWRYRTVNGVLYRRKYNQTTGQWIGKWIKL